MTAWYIDAIDPRGGLAFTSRRDPDLFLDHAGDHETAAVDLQTIFLSPPYFQPTRGPTRAVALAAARGSFQSGFVLGEDEVPFATLDDVTEFVRRVYMSSAGGDGGGGAGGEGETEPGPRFPIEGGGGGGEPIAGPPGLLEAVSAFEATCKGMKLGEKGVPSDWSSLRLISAGGGRQALNDVAAHIIRERLLTLPLNRSNPRALLEWLRGSNATGLLLEQLDLLDSAIDTVIYHPPRTGQGIHELLGSFIHEWDLPGWLNTEHPERLLYELFCEFADWTTRHRRSWAWMAQLRAVNETFDQVEVLRRVTLPEVIAKHLASLANAEQKDLSLYHLLFTMIANPALMKKCGDENIVGWLLVLASVLLAGRRPAVAHVGWQHPYHSPILGIRDLAITEGLAAGVVWLTANLPTRALPAIIEAEIGRAMALRYETALAHV